MRAEVFKLELVDFLFYCSFHPEGRYEKGRDRKL